MTQNKCKVKRMAFNPKHSQIGKTKDTPICFYSSPKEEQEKKADSSEKDTRTQQS